MLCADTFNAFDDKLNQISWVGTHTDWNGNIEDSFYSNRIRINVEQHNAFDSTSKDGSIDVSYCKDVNATRYRLTLYKADNSIVSTYETSNGNELAYTFNGLEGNTEYYVTLEPYNNGYITLAKSIMVTVGVGPW